MRSRPARSGSRSTGSAWQRRRASPAAGRAARASRARDRVPRRRAAAARSAAIAAARRRHAADAGDAVPRSAACASAAAISRRETSTCAASPRCRRSARPRGRGRSRRAGRDRPRHRCRTADSARCRGKRPEHGEDRRRRHQRQHEPQRHGVNSPFESDIAVATRPKTGAVRIGGRRSRLYITATETPQPRRVLGTATWGSGGSA